jgi:hypothetical protein
MPRVVGILGLICVLLNCPPAVATGDGAELNKPIPDAARQAFTRGLRLERSDRV